MVLILSSYIQDVDNKNLNIQENDGFEQEIAFLENQGDVLDFETKNKYKIYYEKTDSHNRLDGQANGVI